MYNKLTHVQICATSSKKSHIPSRLANIERGTGAVQLIPKASLFKQQIKLAKSRYFWNRSYKPSTFKARSAWHYVSFARRHEHDCRWVSHVHKRRSSRPHPSNVLTSDRQARCKLASVTASHWALALFFVFWQLCLWHLCTHVTSPTTPT